ncbi:hypothetical protein V5O48_009369 [Marasmius crinis-equi]|uniref:Biotrophy-associated secreted protein 2 n=1 Tax=Marasmius crinis-equi TaxID=585013 RepID=A0ABR3FBI1_9AGAR
MAKFAVLLALLSVNLVAATYIPRAPAGTQFITGPCNTDADCASGCCGFNSGKCAGAIIALTRDGGCGHGEATNSIAAGILRGNCPGTNAKRSPLSPDPAGASHVGNGKGEQFITGQCTSNADCQSGCCATLGAIGICSGPGAADQQGKTGCGFGGGAGGAPAPPPANNGASGGAAAPPPPPAAPAGRLTAGQTAIGAACKVDNDCTTACCGISSGVCALAKQAGAGGCGGKGGAANANALGIISGNAPVC